jgi:hypothetical protein
MTTNFSLTHSLKEVLMTNRRRDPLSPEARAILDNSVPVVEIHGRWYITAGTPGFNSRINNGRGFSYRSTALIAVTMFTDKKILERAGR